MKPIEELRAAHAATTQGGWEHKEGLALGAETDAGEEVPFYEPNN